MNFSTDRLLRLKDLSVPAAWALDPALIVLAIKLFFW